MESFKGYQLLKLLLPTPHSYFPISVNLLCSSNEQTYFVITTHYKMCMFNPNPVSYVTHVLEMTAGR